MSLKFEFWDRKIVKKRWESLNFGLNLMFEFGFNFNFQMVLKVDVDVMMRLFVTLSELCQTI
jgi:hypothetical protein